LFFDRLIQSWAKTFYVRFTGDTLHVSEVPRGRSLDLPAVIGLRREGSRRRIIAVGQTAPVEAWDDLVWPFAHERLVVHEFEIAEALLQHSLQLMLGTGIAIRPRVIIHPLRIFPGGLTDIERRALRELGESIGATSITVHEGPALTDSEFERRDGYWVPKARAV